MGQYAKGTSVTVDASQQEVTRILHRYKVETYQFGAAPGAASVAFEAAGVPIRIDIALPDKPTRPTMTSPETGRTVQAMPRWEQEVREAWRALVLIIKANLEAVERGIVTVDQAFMAWLVFDGVPLHQRILPAYHQALESGQLQLTAGGGS